MIYKVDEISNDPGMSQLTIKDLKSFEASTFLKDSSKDGMAPDVRII